MLLQQRYRADNRLTSPLTLDKPGSFSAISRRLATMQPPNLMSSPSASRPPSVGNAQTASEARSSFQTPQRSPPSQQATSSAVMATPPAPSTPMTPSSFVRARTPSSPRPMPCSSPVSPPQHALPPAIRTCVSPLPDNVRVFPTTPVASRGSRARSHNGPQSPR
ncbi:hypothetical protein FGB62_1g412 [Gracilaria domingensis]|nr:hypothetical protein FGB62_1g412 [Gracilaria domingensis]